MSRPITKEALKKRGFEQDVFMPSSFSFCEGDYTIYVNFTKDEMVNRLFVYKFNKGKNEELFIHQTKEVTTFEDLDDLLVRLGAGICAEVMRMNCKG